MSMPNSVLYYAWYVHTMLCRYIHQLNQTTYFCFVLSNLIGIVFYFCFLFILFCFQIWMGKYCRFTYEVAVEKLSIWLELNWEVISNWLISLFLWSIKNFTGKFYVSNEKSPKWNCLAHQIFMIFFFVVLLVDCSWIIYDIDNIENSDGFLIYSNVFNLTVKCVSVL